MTDGQFEAERKYQAGMSIARRMLKEGILREDEYRKAESIMRERHKPAIGAVTCF